VRPIEELIALVLDDVDEGLREALEQHVLVCSECAATVTSLLDVEAATARMLLEARGRFPLPASLAEALEARGLVTRRYVVPAGGSVACSAGADDRYVVTELVADLSGVDRVDLLMGGVALALDVPFDRAAGRVSFVEAGEELRRLPTMQVTFQLVGHDAAGARPLGTYTLNHTAA
jgi:hypothetical protein